MAKRAAGPIVLVLDIGSSGVRVKSFDSAGRSVSGVKAKRPHVLATTPDGGAVLDAKTTADACDEAFDATLDLLGKEPQVVGVASDTLVPNILGVDADGVPVTPVLTWGDTRSHADAQALRGRLDPEAYHQRTGCVIHTSYIPAKLLWFQRTERKTYARVARWISLGEYLSLRWFGEARCSHSVASWSGLLNRHTLDWDAETLAALKIGSDRLGTLTDVAAPSRGLTPRYRKRWPALRDVPFVPTIGDGVGSSIGSGCTTTDRVALAIGTSGAMRLMLTGTPAELPPGLWSYRVDQSRCLLGGAVSNGTNVFDWMLRTLNLGDPEALDAALAALPPAGHGLDVLPLLAGERSPGWVDDATAAFVGIRWSTQPIHLLRAALEAVAYRFALIHRSLAPQLPSEHLIVASGKGFVQSPVWVQIMADVLGRPVLVTQEKSATAAGVALLALEALGIQPIPLAPLDARAAVRPDLARHARYQEALARHIALYGKLIGGR